MRGDIGGTEAVAHEPGGRARRGAGGRARREGREESGVLTIDCGTCELNHTSACTDCVVSFLCDRTAGDAVVIDVAEARAIRLLGTGGLVPELRHRRRTG